MVPEFNKIIGHDRNQTNNFFDARGYPLPQYIILDEHLPPELRATLEVFVPLHEVDCVCNPQHILELTAGMSDLELKSVAEYYNAYIATKNVKDFKGYPHLIGIPANGRGNGQKECRQSPSVLKRQVLTIIDRLANDFGGQSNSEYDLILNNLKHGDFDDVFKSAYQKSL